MTRLNYCAIPVHCHTGQRGRDREVTGPMRAISEVLELPIAGRPVIATVRVGVEEAIGDVGVFVSGGPALSRIVNSVTHTDYSGSTCLETDLRLDADDSFRRGSTEAGWAIGAGLEMPLAARWALRLDGSYLDFGSETYRVNLSGNNSCGPGGARTACRYTIRNRLGVVRLGIIYRFAE